LTTIPAPGSYRTRAKVKGEGGGHITK